MDTRSPRYVKLNDPDKLERSTDMKPEVEAAMIKLQTAIFETRKLLHIKQTVELLLAVNHLEEAAAALAKVLSNN